MTVEELVEQTKAILEAKAVIELEEAVELASGQMSRHFVDGKAGLADPGDLQIACAAMAALVDAAGVAACRTHPARCFGRHGHRCCTTEVHRTV